MSRLITFGTPPTPVDATPAPEAPDWVQASPARIERALARALALPSGGWYAVDASARVGATPVGYTVEGQELVLWRTQDGALRAAPGACPHMGASLACARVRGDNLICPWHGLELGDGPHGRWRPLAALDDGVLAWVQLEDHGPRVALGLLRGRGEMGLWFGRDSMETDFRAQRTYAIAVEKYPQLDQDTRDIYEGFAEGANRYIELNADKFPPGFAPRFTGYDIAARDVSTANPMQAARRFLATLDPRPRRTRSAAAAWSRAG